jgi:hypothetical protein
MTRQRLAAFGALIAFAALAAPLSAQQQTPSGSTMGTLGAGVAGELNPGAAAWVPPSGPTPRTRLGKPDFTGVWDHAYVPDMSLSSARAGLQTGAGELPYTSAGRANITAYDPEKDGDYTGMCMPFGLMRSVNAPYPFQIVQNDRQVIFLFEQNNWFHVVPFADTHKQPLEPNWFGHSIAKWDGETLVLETIGFNGFTRLDTRGNPHSEQLRLVQRFTRTDEGHIRYHVTVIDPVFYEKPWTNERTFTLSNGGLLEYSCEENNKSLWEGRIKLWTPPGTSPPRIAPR